MVGFKATPPFTSQNHLKLYSSSRALPALFLLVVRRDHGEDIGIVHGGWEYSTAAVSHHRLATLWLWVKLEGVAQLWALFGRAMHHSLQ